MTKEVLIAEIKYCDRYCELYRLPDGYMPVWYDEIECREDYVFPTLPEALKHINEVIAEEKNYFVVKSATFA